MDMQNCNKKSTPVAVAPIGTDASGEPFKEEWSYSQVVGKLLFLSSNSCTDIQLAVHQCAQFIHFPQ
jgi:hypothetical protein